MGPAFHTAPERPKTTTKINNGDRSSKVEKKHERKPDDKGGKDRKPPKEKN